MSTKPDAVDALAALFDTILAQARANPAFAAQIASDLQALAAAPAPKAGRRRTDPPAIPAIDPHSLYAEGGAEALRGALAGLTRADLIAVIKARDLEVSAPSKRNKANLIEMTVSAVRRRARAASGTVRRRAFDYRDPVEGEGA